MKASWTKAFFDRIIAEDVKRAIVPLFAGNTAFCEVLLAHCREKK